MNKSRSSHGMASTLLVECEVRITPQPVKGSITSISAILPRRASPRGRESPRLGTIPMVLRRRDNWPGPRGVATGTYRARSPALCSTVRSRSLFRCIRSATPTKPAISIVRRASPLSK